MLSSRAIRIISLLGLSRNLQYPFCTARGDHADSCKGRSEQSSRQNELRNAPLDEFLKAGSVTELQGTGIIPSTLWLAQLMFLFRISISITDSHVWWYQ